MNLKLRKQLFLAVRDLPYKISNQSTDTSCVAKTKILGELFTRLGFGMPSVASRCSLERHRPPW